MNTLTLSFLASSAVVALTSILGCNPQNRDVSYCLNDSECSAPSICNMSSRRCTIPNSESALTDAALDRVLDMEIDAKIPDVEITDTAPMDAGQPIDSALDASLADSDGGDVPDATNVTDALLLDATISVYDQGPLDVQDADQTMDSGSEANGDSGFLDALL